MTAFAAFIVSTTTGGYAATTRAADRGEAGRIGLPGGKVDPGETDEQAAMREAKEEGWLVHGPLIEIQRKLVDGKECVWFHAPFAVRLTDYKEMHRIQTIVATKEEIAASGYGNDFLADSIYQSI